MDEGTGERPSSLQTAQRDVYAGAIVVGAVMMLIGTGTSIAQPLIDWVAEGTAGQIDRWMLSTLLLNVALVLFGWRRYRDLNREVAGQAEIQCQVHDLAYKDSLTGLHNRRSLTDAARAMLAVTSATRRSTALMIVDLDHFKHVNDVHGHLTGDRLLQGVAEIIVGFLPPHAVPARLGGDEYAIMLPYDPAHPESVTEIGEAIVERLRHAIDAGGVLTHVGASIGIAHSDEDAGDIQSLLRRADIALYAAKRHGRGRCVWFDQSMETELRLRSSVEEGLRAGIPIGQFVPYYEQQIDLETGDLHGFEVLARWEHPTLGVIGPDHFIAIAEESGLIGELSMAVMKRAFEEARDWDSGLVLSVNISPMQLRDPWLAEKILKLLTETGFPANRLEIEITENALLENLQLAQTIVGSLKNQGIRLALDDFGTGYSSLAHLRALPFDRIKIDRSFVQSVISDPESSAIVNAISGLAASLSLPITAEGVEDGFIEERLKSIGCAKGQGYHFGKPMTLDQVRKLLGDQSAARIALAEESAQAMRRAG